MNALDLILENIASFEYFCDGIVKVEPDDQDNKKIKFTCKNKGFEFCFSIQASDNISSMLQEFEKGFKKNRYQKRLLGGVIDYV